MKERCICLSATLTDSAFRIGKKIYPEVFKKNVNTLSKKKDS